MKIEREGETPYVVGIGYLSHIVGPPEIGVIVSSSSRKLESKYNLSGEKRKQLLSFRGVS